ncbi:MAG: hypothetical protein MZW92_77840 [Comamonadaceae bacterium]|nr:hypothetical protein [Comamonadaceae bacterium]
MTLVTAPLADRAAAPAQGRCRRARRSSRRRWRSPRRDGLEGLTIGALADAAAR